MSRAPAVTVIVPMFNTGRLVLDALGSVCAQTLERWEAIVVDDGSSDEGPGLVEALAEVDPRVRLIRRARGGVSAARNAGLDAARGDWIVFLDSDDLLEPTAMETLTTVGASAGTDGAFGAYAVSTAAGDPMYTYADDRDEVGLDDLFDRSYIWTAAHAVRREAIGTLRFDESLIGYEDRDLWLRLAENGVRWRCTSAPVSRYRIRRGSASKDAGEMLRCAQRVVTGCWRRQESLSAGGRLLELTPDRLDRALGHLAVGYAGRAAILDGPEAAQRVLGEASGVRELRPRALARAGQFAVVYGLGAWPEPVAGETTGWAAALHAWWRLCEADGFLPRGGADEALAALREPLVIRGRGTRAAA